MKRIVALFAVIAAALTLTGCDLDRNPRRDACTWLDGLPNSNVVWDVNPNRERGGICVLVFGAISLNSKEECTRVIGARNRLGQYKPRATAGQIANYCYIH